MTIQLIVTTGISNHLMVSKFGTVCYKPTLILNCRPTMKHLLEAYSDQLFAIAQAYSLSKHVDSHLSEEELVSGMIMAHWADHNK